LEEEIREGDMNEFKLAREIIALSASQNWDAAKLEWFLQEIYFEDEPGVCLCGHTPIIETCVLKNKANGNIAIVGNVCVKKFMGLNSDKIFQAVKRVRKEIDKSLNAEAIEYALEKGWINSKDKSFYLDVFRKRNLSEKQLKWKKDVNSRVLKGITNNV
jgi:hypothetical protein